MMKYSLFKIPSQFNKGLFKKLEYIISLVLPQLYIIQCFKKTIIIYNIDVPKKMFSYKLVIENQHILHMLVHQVQYNIIYILYI